MADSNDTIVKIKTVPDTSGSQAVQKDLKKTANVAEQAANSASNSFKKMTGGLASVRAAAGRVQQALSFFTHLGFLAAGIDAATNLVEKFTAGSKKAREEARKLAEENQKNADKKAIEELADAYKKLSDAISDAAKARERVNELEDIGRNQARDLEDKEAQLAKIRAINALDPNDPHYAEKKAAIDRKFEEASASRSVTRAREDNATERRRLEERAEAIGGDAGQLEFSLHDDDTKIAELLARAKKLRDSSTRRNSYDDDTAGQLKNLLHFRYGARTEQGDAERNRQKEESKRLEEEAKQLKKERDAKALQVARMRAEAEHLGNKALALGGQEDSFDAADLINAANAEQPKIQAAAARRVIRGGGEKTAELHRQEDSERARAQAAADRYAAEQGDVIEAQNRYDMLVANGGSRKEKSAALEALQKEQAEAQEAKHEMEKVAAQVATTLQGINAQIKALASAVQKAENRLAQNQADAPEG